MFRPENVQPDVVLYAALWRRVPAGTSVWSNALTCGETWLCGHEVVVVVLVERDGLVDGWVREKEEIRSELDYDAVLLKRRIC